MALLTVIGDVLRNAWRRARRWLGSAVYRVRYGLARKVEGAGDAIDKRTNELGERIAGWRPGFGELLHDGEE